MLEATLPQQTVRYLNQVLGGESVRVAPSGNTAQLPYFLQDTYEVLPGELLGQPITLACVKGRQPLAAQQVDQHAKRLRELLHAPVIIALPEVAPGERKQLIAHGVGPQALRAYDDQLCKDISALVLRNRGSGPFGLLGLVDERCGGVFDHIDDVLPREEREGFMARYKAAAGFAIETLNAAPPTIAPGQRVAAG